MSVYKVDQFQWEGRRVCLSPRILEPYLEEEKNVGSNPQMRELNQGLPNLDYCTNH